MPRQLWLPKVLIEAGLEVYVEPGWEDRGSSRFKPVGVMWHHTATGTNWSTKNLTNLLTNGRSDLKGPLCHLQLNRDGVYIVIAAGKANHAGTGKWKDIRYGNTNFIGIEAANDGRGEPWPDAQIAAYRIGTAAILKHLNSSADYLVGHKEWAPSRKIDPKGLDMAVERAEVSLIMSGHKKVSVPKPEKVQDNAESNPILRYNSSGSDVAYLQRRLDAHGFDPGPIDGDFGPRTLAQTKSFQAKKGLKPDGIVGRLTWAELKKEPSVKVVNDSGAIKSAPAKKIEKTTVPPAKFSQNCLSQVLKSKSRGNCVAVLQRRLNQLGFPCGAPDGVFGKKTTLAVKRFQSNRKLLVDGVVGKKTWSELQK